MKIKKIRTQINNSKEFYNFKLYPNTEPINIGDMYMYNFGGVWNILKCSSEEEKIQINPNTIKKNPNKIDFISGFWKRCYKIKNTNLDLEKYEY